jgi:protein phosphatase
MKVHHSARTDVGKTRDHNEDSYGIGEGPQVEQVGAVLVICDGMGGHAAGEVASRIGVDTILARYYEDDDEDRPVALERAFEEANAQIYAKGHGSMGTTGVAALLHHDALHIANVGDSRAYLLRDGSLRQVSRDHSFVSDQVAAGLITAEQARSSPHRNVITRALGYQPDVTVDLFRLPLQIGDVVLLCSDGLHGLVSDAELSTLAAQAGDEAVKQLVDLANQRGGLDNITVVLARVDALDWDSQPVTETTETSHERVTVELPTPDQTVTVEQPALVAPAAPPPARAPERRLTLLGGLLATLLLTVLVFAILLTLNRPVTDGVPTAFPATQPALIATAALPATQPALIATAALATQPALIATAAPALTTTLPQTRTALPTGSPAPRLTPTGAATGAASGPGAPAVGPPRP